MPSFAISQFIILLEALWVSAVFLLLSTGPNLDGTYRTAVEAACQCGRKKALLQQLSIPREIEHLDRTN